MISWVCSFVMIMLVLFVLFVLFVLILGGVLFVWWACIGVYLSNISRF